MSAHYVYRCYDREGSLLYVGQTQDANARLAQHRTRAFWAADVVQVKVTVHRTPEIARAVERRAIREEHPRFNYQGRWETRSSWSKQGWVDYARTMLNAPYGSARSGRVERVFTEYEARFAEPHPMAEATRERQARDKAVQDAEWEKRREEWNARSREIQLADRRAMVKHILSCDACADGFADSDDCPDILADLESESVASARGGVA